MQRIKKIGLTILGTAFISFSFIGCNEEDVKEDLDDFAAASSKTPEEYQEYLANKETYNLRDLFTKKEINYDTMIINTSEYSTYMQVTSTPLDKTYIDGIEVIPVKYEIYYFYEDSDFTQKPDIISSYDYYSIEDGNIYQTKDSDGIICTRTNTPDKKITNTTLSTSGKGEILSCSDGTKEETTWFLSKTGNKVTYKETIKYSDNTTSYVDYTLDKNSNIISSSANYYDFSIYDNTSYTISPVSKEYPIVVGNYRTKIQNNEINMECTNGNYYKAPLSDIDIFINQNDNKLSMKALVGNDGTYGSGNIEKDGSFSIFENSSYENNTEGNVFQSLIFKGKFNNDKWYGDVTIKTNFKDFSFKCEGTTTFTGEKLTY